MTPPLRARGWVAAMLAVVVAMLAFAGPALAADLTPQQESQAKSIEGKLIAPCCWTQTVADHESNASEEIKAGIRSMLAGGSSEQDIISFYKERYGERILAAPEKSGFNLMAYLFPAAMTLVALAVIVVMLQRWRSREEAVTPVRVERTADTGDEALRRRLDDELNHYRD